VNIVLIFNVYPLQPSPNRYYILIFVGFLVVGVFTSRLRPWQKAASLTQQPTPTAV